MTIWPGDATFAFLVTIDVDGDLPLLAADPANIARFKSRSVGLHGPEHGAARLLRVLEAHDLRADWFIPGEIARRYPDLVRELAEHGQGIGAHGDRHLDFDKLSLPEQVAEMLGGRDALAEIVDEAPAGFRTPQGEWAAGFPEAMAQAGFSWSSSLPYAELPFILGPTGLVEIPFRFELEDQQYLGYNLDPPFPPGQSRITPLELVEENWDFELEGAARYGTLLHLRLNAEVMGFAGRARMLDRFLTKVCSSPGVWLTSCDELSGLVAASDVTDDEHPYDLFLRLTASQ